MLKHAYFCRDLIRFLNIIGFHNVLTLMKMKFTCFASQVKAWCLVAAIGVFSIWSAQGQSGSIREELGYLSQVTWQSPADAVSAMNAERARYNAALAWPALPSVDKAIYKAYLRLLDYTEVLLQNGKTLDEAIVEAYEKVMAEAPADPELKEMPEGILFTYIPGLVELLTEVHIPQLSGQ